MNINWKFVFGGILVMFPIATLVVMAAPLEFAVTLIAALIMSAMITVGIKLITEA